MSKRLSIAIIGLLLALSFVGQVYARSKTFSIEPCHEIAEIIDLQTSESVVGNVSANGLIDFYVSSPSGNVIYCVNKTTFTAFSFTASENGNFTLHLSNTHLTQRVTVELKYSVNMSITVGANINVGTSAGVAIIVPPPPPPLNLDDEPNLNSLYERYLNFLKGSEILQTVRDCGTYLLICGMALASCIALAARLEMGKRHSQQKNVFNMRIRRCTDSQ
jgi:hypothetical protein